LPFIVDLPNKTCDFPTFSQGFDTTMAQLRHAPGTRDPQLLSQQLQHPAFPARRLRLQLRWGRAAWVCNMYMLYIYIWYRYVQVHIWYIYIYAYMWDVNIYIYVDCVIFCNMLYMCNIRRPRFCWCLGGSFINNHGEVMMLAL
jgi:hypothetical protein